MLDRLAALSIVLPFLRDVEGLDLLAYRDDGTPGGGPWTIGYGHTGPDVKEGDTITQDQAEIWLSTDAGNTADLIAPRLPSLLNPNQYASLISFTYNVGPGRAGSKSGFLILKNGNPSTLLRMVQNLPVNPTVDELEATAEQFLPWCHAGSAVVAALCTRRKKEHDLFLTPYSQAPLGVTPDSEP